VRALSSDLSEMLKNGAAGGGGGGGVDAGAAEEVETGAETLTKVPKDAHTERPPRGRVDRNVDSLPPGSRVILIGDLHGNLIETEQLFANLRSTLGNTGLRRSKIVFLGDYVDRGPDSRGVIDFLLELRAARAVEDGTGGTYFIAGNHDLGMATFIGVPCCDEASVSAEALEATRNVAYKKGFFVHPVEGGMHYQGRRWGGSTVYNCHACFSSYGAGDADYTAESRERLVKAVPDAHKEFLQGLDLCHDAPIPFGPGRLICVHAGLSPDVPAEEQLERLRARDILSPSIQHPDDASRIPALHSRGAVIPMHRDLVGKAIVVSGHHGTMDVNSGDRIIMDLSGGTPSENRPLACMVLSATERFVVGHAESYVWPKSGPSGFGHGGAGVSAEAQAQRGGLLAGVGGVVS